MGTDRVAEQILRRGRSAGLTPSADLAVRLAAYLELLAYWNERINLTAFGLDPPTDSAIDRLIVEPLAAAEMISDSAALVAVDIGSGGGSPAIPLKLARPNLRMTLVEARTKKSAVLRELVRSLGLADVVVETRRIDRPADVPEAWRGTVDVITLRAVRADRPLVNALVSMLRRGGQILAFGDSGIRPNTFIEVSKSIETPGSTVTVFRKR